MWRHWCCCLSPPNLSCLLQGWSDSSAGWVNAGTRFWRASVSAECAASVPERSTRCLLAGVLWRYLRHSGAIRAFISLKYHESALRATLWETSFTAEVGILWVKCLPTSQRSQTPRCPWCRIVVVAVCDTSALRTHPSTHRSIQFFTSKVKQGTYGFLQWHKARMRQSAETTRIYHIYWFWSLPALSMLEMSQCSCVHTLLLLFLQCYSLGQWANPSFVTTVTSPDIRTTNKQWQPGVHLNLIFFPSSYSCNEEEKFIWALWINKWNCLVQYWCKWRNGSIKVSVVYIIQMRLKRGSVW